VLDLKGGVVVRARMGKRDDYRPIETPLSPTSSPIDVMRGLLTVHPFRSVYVADLDAIEGRGDHRDVLARLKSQFDVDLWVDNGIAELATANHWLATGLGRLVVGSETQRDGVLVRRLGSDPRVVLSLDFRGDAFQGPPALLGEPEHWPQQVIVMTLARVGSGAGPDTGRLAQIRDAAGSARAVYAAGGVRDASDLAALARARITGALVATCLHDGRLTAVDIRTLISRAPDIRPPS